MVVVDYYSNFIEVERLTTITTSGVCKSLKSMFSRYGIPDKLVSDNGPQFSSAEFTKFAKDWGLQHLTSSPRYPHAVKRKGRKQCQNNEEAILKM